jgi:hypothetical protein
VLFDISLSHHISYKSWIILQLGLAGPLLQVTRTVGTEVSLGQSHTLRFLIATIGVPSRTRALEGSFLSSCAAACAQSAIEGRR